MKNIQIPSPNKYIGIILLQLLLYSCASEEKVNIQFNALVNDEVLEFGKNYAAPNGDGTFRINDFKVYVSNVQLVDSKKPENNFLESDSYHLLKFQSGNISSFTLNDVSLSSHDQIRISVGIDEKGNLSKEYPGDLDPTNQMAWNWTVGYKFLLFEGMYSPESSENEVPLVFHIGFSENKKDLVFALNAKENINFDIEISELFTNPNPIDFNELPTVLFNKEHSALVASNYAKAFIRLRKNPKP